MEGDSVELSGIGQNTLQNTQATKEVNQSVQSVAKSLEGFTPIVSYTEVISAQATNIARDVGDSGWFHETLTKLLGYSESSQTGDDEARSLQESMIDSLGEIIDFNDVTGKDDKVEKKKKGKVSSSSKFDDLKDLPWALGTLGAVLANTITKKDDKGKKGGISGFFKGLMEGVSGIAALGVALLAFAGAALLFNFVDWGKAVIGMLAFTIFTIGMVALAKILGKEEKDLTMFAESSLIMSAALGAFAISLYIASILMSNKPIDIGGVELPAFDIGGAIAALVAFGLFEFGMAKLAKFMGKDIADFSKFALGSLIMTGALVAFSVALVIASNIFANGIDVGPFAKFINGGDAGSTILKIDPIGAAAALVTFLLFEKGLAVVASMVGEDTGDFVKFAVGSLIMTGALVAFSLALVVVSGILTNGVNIKVGDTQVNLPKVDILAAAAGVGMFLVFLTAVVVLANVAQGFMGQIAIFGAVSVLMSASLIAFSVAMVTAGVAAFGGSADVFGLKFTAPEGTGVKALAAIPLMAAFMGAFAGLGALFLIPFAGQAMMAGIVMASTVLMMIAGATILMSKAMMLASGVVTGGQFEIEGQKYNLLPYNEAGVNGMFNIMMSFMTKFAELGNEIGIKGAIVTAILAKSLFPIIEAMDKMVSVVIRAGENKDLIMEIVNGDSNALDHLMDPVLYVILGSKLDGEGGLMFVANSMDKKSAKVLALVAKAIVPITDAMLNMIDVVVKAANNRQAIADLMATEGGMSFIDHLLDPVLWLILGTKVDGTGGLMYVAEELGKSGAKTLKLVAEAMVPLIEAMDKMLDVVLKAATLNAEGMTVDELVKLAMTNLNLIMVGNPVGTGFLPMFIMTAMSLEDTSKNAIEAIKSMPPMVDALSGMIDVVAKAGEIDPNTVKTGVFSLNAVAGFLETFIDTVGRIIPGGVGGFFSKLGGGDPIKKLKEAHEYMQPGGVFYEIFKDLANIAKTFDGKGFESLGKVAVIGSFTTGMLESSVNFKDIMVNIQEGIKKFKDTATLTEIGRGLDSIAKSAEIGNKFDPLYELAKQSVQLHSVAADLDKIASSYERISAADKLGRLPTDFKGNLSGPSVAEQKGNNDAAPVQPVQKGQELVTIANILNEWNQRGVRVYGIDTGDKKKAIKTINI